MSAFHPGKLRLGSFGLDGKEGGTTAKKFGKGGSGNSKTEIRKMIYVSNEDREEVQSWVNSQGTSAASGRNKMPPEVVVMQWVYKKGVICSLCPKELRTISGLVKHLERDHEIRVRKVPVTNGSKNNSEGGETPIQNTASASLFPAVHCLPQEEDNPYIQSGDVMCPLAKCGETFPSILSVNKHLKMDHKSIFTFSFDDKNEDTTIELEAEKPSEIRPKSKEITQADVNPSMLVPPLDNNTPRPTNSCQKCGSVFKYRRSLNTHLRKMTCNSILEQNKAMKAFAQWEVEVDGKKMYECPICLYRNAGRYKFGRHVLFNHADTTLEQKIKDAKLECLLVFARNKRKCSECQNVFHRPILLQQHLKSFHKVSVTASEVVEAEKYSVNEGEILTNVEKGKEEAVNVAVDLPPSKCIPEFLPEIETANIPQNNVVPENPPHNYAYTLEDNNNGDPDLQSVLLDEENLKFFGCGIDAIDTIIESRYVENFPGYDLLGLQAGIGISPNEKRGLHSSVEVSENEDISLEEGEELNHVAESEALSLTDGCHDTLDDSDIELPPPGFEEEEFPPPETSTTLEKKRSKRKKTPTDYSFIQRYKMEGAGTKFQCPHCSQTAVGSIHFCRHLIICHPLTELAKEVSAKRIKWLHGVERRKYKCNICGSIAACASNLSIHFKKVHKRKISIDEVMERTELLGPEELIVSAELSDQISVAPSHQGGLPLLQEKTAAGESKFLDDSPHVAVSNDEQIRPQKVSKSGKITAGNREPISNFGHGLEVEDKAITLQKEINDLVEPISNCEDDTILASLSPLQTVRKQPSKKDTAAKRRRKRKAIELSESVNCTEDSNCPFCGKDKQNFSNFKKHIAWHEKREEQKVSRKEGKVCPICEEILQPERNLNLHIFWHKRNGDVAYNSDAEIEEEDEGV